MISRRHFLRAAGVGVLVTPGAARAQKPAKTARIGFLGLGSAESTASRLEVFRGSLRDLGYVEGKSYVMEYRWAGVTSPVSPIWPMSWCSFLSTRW